MEKKTEIKKETQTNIGLNTVCRTVQCFDNNGHKNFKILTLNIKDGKIIDVKYSDAYASFEVISRVELANWSSINNLNMNWKNGKCLSQ